MSRKFEVIKEFDIADPVDIELGITMEVGKVIDIDNETLFELVDEINDGASFNETLFDYLKPISPAEEILKKLIDYNKNHLTDEQQHLLFMIDFSGENECVLGISEDYDHTEKDSYIPISKEEHDYINSLEELIDNEYNR